MQLVPGADRVVRHICIRCIALPITIKRLPGPVTERGGYQRPPSMAINTTTTFDFFGFLSAWRKNIRIQEKSVYTAKLSGFKVTTLDSGFKISGDMTKPGCFHFRFVLLCVNGKTNLVLKRSGFITNPQQFPLV